MDLYEHSSHQKNLAHFATLASLAAIDGVVSPEEKEVLDKFAFKLNITETEYKEVMKKENKYPIETPPSLERRYERLFDFFKMIFSDNVIDDEERALVGRYAIGLGFSPDQADAIIKKSIDIFTGKIAFEDYYHLMKK